MLKSKALKDGALKGIPEPGVKYSKLYEWWLDSGIWKKWDNFTWKCFRKPIYDLKKMLGWYFNVFRNDFDFDGHCLFAIIEYKLKRVEKVLINGHAIQEDRDMKALRLAIKLAGRLKEDKYQEAFWDRHEKKWGKMHTWFEPCNDGTDNSYWRSSRPKAKTKKEKSQERKDFSKMCSAIDAQTNREQKWFYEILNKYQRVWWD